MRQIEITLFDAGEDGNVERRTAVISKCGSYRYALTRLWNTALLPALFIGLNPSTADADIDDPTIRRMRGFAKQWGCGGFVVVNLFAFRATDPADMKRAVDPIGIECDDFIRQVVSECSPVIACWGAHGKFKNRNITVSSNIRNLKCFGVNKDGSPKHPLYLASNTQLVGYGEPSK